MSPYELSPEALLRSYERACTENWVDSGSRRRRLNHLRSAIFALIDQQTPPFKEGETIQVKVPAEGARGVDDQGRHGFVTRHEKPVVSHLCYERPDKWTLELNNLDVFRYPADGFEKIPANMALEP